MRRSTLARNESGNSAPTWAHFALKSATEDDSEWRWIRNSARVESARPWSCRVLKSQLWADVSWEHEKAYRVVDELLGD